MWFYTQNSCPTACCSFAGMFILLLKTDTSNGQECNNCPEISQKLPGSVCFIYLEKNPSNSKTSHCNVTDRYTELLRMSL